MKIELNAKLSAFTRGLLPDVSKFIEDAPKDSLIYARKNGEWVVIDGESFGDEIQLLENSGLILQKDNNIAKIGIRQQVLSKEEFDKLTVLDNDTTYYVYKNDAELYIDGGTAFSDSYYDDILEEQIPSQYETIIEGGNSQTQLNYNIIMTPLNSLGE